MPKVSIIIPIYNAEQTLIKCLDSILHQTFDDFEIIAINDGSTDNSQRILYDYADRDSRLIIINQPNGGVASARQAGIEAATGNYAIHVDPDDWIEPNMLEALINSAESTNSDMVICDYFSDSAKSTNYICQQPTSNDADTVLKELFQQLHGSCCNKLISSAYYKAQAFEKGLNLSEDLLYICKILLQNPKIACLPKAYYHYQIAPTGSLSTSYNKDKFHNLYKVINELNLLFQRRTVIQDLMMKRMYPYLAFVGACAKDLNNNDYLIAMRGFKIISIKNTSSIKRKLLLILSFCGFRSILNHIIR